MNYHIILLKINLLFLIGLPLSPTSAQEQLGSDIDGWLAEYWFGYSIDLSNDGHRVAIGAPRLGRGYAAVYQWQQGQWQLMGDTIQGKADFISFGERVSLSGDGNRLAVMALGFDDTPAHIRTYNWDGNQWVPVEDEITALTAEFIGSDMALSRDGKYIATGNREDYGFWGQVRAFKFNARFNDWVQYGGTFFGRSSRDAFGSSVAISDDGQRFIFGAADGNSGIDFARIYKYDTRWEKIGEVFAEDNEGEFGASVAISGSGHRIAVGSPYNSGNGQHAGSVRVYQQENDRWVQLGGDIDGEAPFQLAGYDIDLSADGNRILIGARNTETSQGEFTGAMRLYEFINDDWVKIADIEGEAERDNFGWSVALSGDGNRFAGGALFNDGNGDAAGHVRVYDLLTTSISSPPVKTTNIKVYPNPGTGHLFFTIPKNLQLDRIKIYTTSGQLMTESSLSTDQINVSQLPPGLYFLEFYTDDQVLVSTTKIVLQH